MNENGIPKREERDYPTRLAEHHLSGPAGFSWAFGLCTAGVATPFPES